VMPPGNMYGYTGTTGTGTTGTQTPAQLLEQALTNLQTVGTTTQNQIQQANQQSSIAYQGKLTTASAALTASDAAATAEHTAGEAASTATLNTSLAGIQATRVTAQQSSDATFSQGQATANAAYDSSIVAATATMNTAIDGHAATYSSALQSLGAANDQAWTAANSIYHAALTTAGNVLAAGTAGAQAILTAAESSADIVRQSALAANQTVLQNARAVHQSTYNAAASQAPGFDPAAADSDSGFQAALSQAEAAWTQGLQQINATYNTTILNAENAYNTTVASATSVFNAAVAAAELQRQSDLNAANAEYATKIQTASNEFATAVATATSARDGSIQSAQAVLTAAQAAAQATYTTTFNGAMAEYTTVTTTANDEYNQAYGGLSTAFETDSRGLWDSYSADTDTYAQQHNSTVAGLQTTYNDEVKAADKALKDSVWFAHLVLNAAQIAAGVEYGSTEAGAWAAKQFQYGLFWAAETAWFMPQIMSNDPGPLPESIRDIALSAAKVFDGVGAGAAVTYATSLQDPQNAAASADAGAQATLAIRVGNASLELLVGSANAAFSFASSAASRRGTYLTSLADREAAFDNAVLTIEETRDKALALADKNLAIKLINASLTQSIAVTMAQGVYDLAAIEAEHTFSDAVADAGLANAMAVAAADEELTNATVAADLTFVTSLEGPSINYGHSLNGAESSRQTAYIGAWATVVTGVAQLNFNAVFTVENARMQAAMVQNAGNANAVTAAVEYGTKKIANAMSELSAQQGMAMATSLWAGSLNAAWLAMANAVVSLNAAQTTSQAQAAADLINEGAAADREYAKDAADASHTADIADNTAAATAATAEVGYNTIRDLAVAAFGAAADRRSATDDYNKAIAEIAAYVIKERDSIANDLTQAKTDAEAFVIAAIAVAGAERDLGIARATAQDNALPASVNAEKAAMIATAAKRIQDGVDAVIAHQTEVNARPTSYYINELYSASQNFDNMLNTTTDFFAGWANTLTLGGYMGVLGDTSYLNQVNPDSTAFMAGEIVGAVHQIVIGFGAGSGVCQVGRLIQIARVYTTAGSVVGVGKVVAKAWTQGGSSLGVMDYLALAPVAGKVLGFVNRMCFVAGTPVVIGFAADNVQLAALGLVSDEDLEAAQAWSTTWLAAAGIVLAAQQVLLLRKRRKLTSGNLAASRVNEKDERDLADWWSRSEEHEDLLQFGFNSMASAVRPSLLPAC